MYTGIWISNWDAQTWPLDRYVVGDRRCTSGLPKQAPSPLYPLPTPTPVDHPALAEIFGIDTPEVMHQVIEVMDVYSVIANTAIILVFIQMFWQQIFIKF